MEKIKTKDRILLAALDLFSEKGYDQTSIDLVAEAVGIKGPSIYAHYKGCLLYTSPSPRDDQPSRMPSSA